jgi:hypothetical protein
MESAILGLVLDSSTVIRAERSKQSIPSFIEAILQAHGPLDLSLSNAGYLSLAEVQVFGQ